MQGGWGKVLGMSREERPQAVRMRLADGSAMFCSGEHVWPTLRGEQLTADIKVGDVMIRNRPQIFGEMTVDESIAWTVGLYLAEGHCDRGHVRFAIAADEIESFIPTVQKAASIVGGKVSASRRTTGNAGDIIVTGPAFAGLMQQFTVGSDCYGKHLSKYSWRQGNDFIRILLNGYLDGDGHKLHSEGRPQNKWILGFTGENFALADDLRCISSVLGHRHSLGRGVSTCNGIDFPTYEGWISFDEPRYNGKNLEEVVDIRVVNQKSVLYDIEVEDPHLFMLPNGIVSHNSKVDATLSATRSSGIFTQDMEDIAAAEAEQVKAHQAQHSRGGAEKTKQAQKPGEATIQLVSTEERKAIFDVAKESGYKSKPEIMAYILGQFGVKSTDEITATMYPKVLDALRAKGSQHPASSTNQQPVANQAAQAPAGKIISDPQKGIIHQTARRTGWEKGGGRPEDPLHQFLRREPFCVDSVAKVREDHFDSIINALMKDPADFGFTREQ
jgi:hypothetical protein